MRIPGRLAIHWTVQGKVCVGYFITPYGIGRLEFIYHTCVPSLYIGEPAAVSLCFTMDYFKIALLQCLGNRTAFTTTDNAVIQ